MLAVKVWISIFLLQNNFETPIQIGKVDKWQVLYCIVTFIVLYFNICTIYKYLQLEITSSITTQYILFCSQTQNKCVVSSSKYGNT